jgi:hypothetical protein
MESTVKKIITAVVLTLMPVYLWAGTISITSPSKNITASFSGALVIESPTINVTVDGKQFVFTQKQMKGISTLGQVMYIPEFIIPVGFLISIGK